SGLPSFRPPDALSLRLAPWTDASRISDDPHQRGIGRISLGADRRGDVSWPDALLVVSRRLASLSAVPANGLDGALVLLQWRSRSPALVSGRDPSFAGRRVDQRCDSTGGEVRRHAEENSWRLAVAH